MKRRKKTQPHILNKNDVKIIKPTVFALLICLTLIGCGVSNDGEAVTESQNSDSTIHSEDKKTNFDDEYAAFPPPVWESKTDSFFLPCFRMTVEDAVRNYAITLVGNGKYSDYEGDIGDIIPEYKGRDLDGDGAPDVIRHEGKHYIIAFSCKASVSFS